MANPDLNDFCFFVGNVICLGCNIAYFICYFRDWILKLQRSANYFHAVR